MRRAARTDATHTAIVEALRKSGATVHSLAAVGRGMPDLLVGHAGQTLLLEVKNGALSPSRRQLTPDQQDFMRTWTGGPVAVVDGVEAALRVLASLSAQAKPQ